MFIRLGRCRACYRWLRTEVESRRFAASLQGSFSSLFARLPSQGSSREAPVVRDAPRFGSRPALARSPRPRRATGIGYGCAAPCTKKMFADGVACGRDGGRVRGFASGLGSCFRRGRAAQGIGPVSIGVRFFPNPVPDWSLESSRDTSRLEWMLLRLAGIRTPGGACPPGVEACGLDVRPESYSSSAPNAPTMRPSVP